jgi:hypothetical protein
LIEAGDPRRTGALARQGSKTAIEDKTGKLALAEPERKCYNPRVRNGSDSDVQKAL